MVLLVFLLLLVVVGGVGSGLYVVLYEVCLIISYISRLHDVAISSLLCAAMLCLLCYVGRHGLGRARLHALL